MLTWCSHVGQKSHVVPNPPILKHKVSYNVHMPASLSVHSTIIQIPSSKDYQLDVGLYTSSKRLDHHFVTLLPSY